MENKQSAKCCEEATGRISHYSFWKVLENGGPQQSSYLNRATKIFAFMFTFDHCKTIDGRRYLLIISYQIV